MTPDDLLAAVRAQLDATERIAQQAADRYVTTRDGQPVWPLPTVRALFRDRDPGIAAGLTLIEMCNPAAVLRRVAADKRVFERHKPADARVEWSTFVCRRICAYCSDAAEHWHGDFSQREWLIDDEDQTVAWPCLDFRDLADGLGIDLEETPPAEA